jgi:hypothetical protein
MWAQIKVSAPWLLVVCWNTYEPIQLLTVDKCSAELQQPGSTGWGVNPYQTCFRMLMIDAGLHKVCP